MRVAPTPASPQIEPVVPNRILGFTGSSGMCLIFCAQAGALVVSPADSVAAAAVAPTIKWRRCRFFMVVFLEQLVLFGMTFGRG